LLTRRLATIHSISADRRGDRARPAPGVGGSAILAWRRPRNQPRWRWRLSPCRFREAAAARVRRASSVAARTRARRQLGGCLLQGETFLEMLARPRRPMRSTSTDDRLSRPLDVFRRTSYAVFDTGASKHLNCVTVLLREHGDECLFGSGHRDPCQGAQA